jgi:phage/plasmid-like protein (TIGR03299 family)
MLDEIIAATERNNSLRVLSEQHDASQIDFAAGMTDPREMLAHAGFTQRADETMEQFIARVRRDATGAARQLLIEAAQRRAALATDGRGRIDFVAEGRHAPPWHRLGVTVSRAMTAREVAQYALDWRVYVEPYRLSDGTESRLARAVRRSDTGAELGCVGTKYQPIQNAEALSFADAVLAEGGAHFVAAGALHGGRIIFACLEFPKHAFAVAGKDWQTTHAVISNPHDGSGCATWAAVTQRVECGNTHRLALAGAKATIRIRHTGSISDKVRAARKAMGLTLSAAEEHRQRAERWANTVTDTRAFFDSVADAVARVTLDEINAGPDIPPGADREQRERIERAFERARKDRADLVNGIIETHQRHYDGSRTVWAALQAVTEYADFGRHPGRKVGSAIERAERRFEADLLSPAGQPLKAAALARAMAL